jgi:hypothetical protein
MLNVSRISSQFKALRLPCRKPVLLLLTMVMARKAGYFSNRSRGSDQNLRGCGSFASVQRDADMDNLSNIGGWTANWAWGLPLIVFTVILHAYSLGLLNTEVTATLNRKEQLLRVPVPIQSFVIGGTALLLTVLHGVEGIIWATAYRLLGASVDNKSAMLYSLNALTSYGHEELHLAPHWKMMGALEALNGWILFGLTTAFLFTVVQRAWLPPSAEQTSL